MSVAVNQRRNGNDNILISNCREEDFPESKINGQQVVLVNWGWLTPTGGMYASADDLAQVRIIM